MLLAVSCKEEVVKGFNDLSPAEQAAIRAASYAKCKNESERNFRDFAETSNQNMLDWNRGSGWKHVIKKEDQVTEDGSSIRIWKEAPANGDTVYLLYTFKSSGTLRYKFVKLSTISNSAMIAELKERKCDSVRYSDTITDNASSLNLKPKESRDSSESDTYLITNNTFTFNFNYPAFFGNFQQKQVDKTYNKDDESLKTTVNYTYSLSALSNPTALNNNYTDYAADKREYCVIKEVAGPPVYNFPYILDCKNDGEAAPPFNPAELVI